MLIVCGSIRVVSQRCYVFVITKYTFTSDNNGVCFCRQEIIMRGGIAVLCSEEISKRVLGVNPDAHNDGVVEIAV